MFHDCVLDLHQRGKQLPEAEVLVRGQIACIA